MRAHAAGQERVAVRRRRRHPAASERAAGAADILYYQVLAKNLAHLLGHDAGHHITRTAGGERHHDRDRPLWVRTETAVG